MRTISDLTTPQLVTMKRQYERKIDRIENDPNLLAKKWLYKDTVDGYHVILAELHKRI